MVPFTIKFQYLGQTGHVDRDQDFAGLGIANQEAGLLVVAGILPEQPGAIRNALLIIVVFHMKLRLNDTVFSRMVRAALQRPTPPTDSGLLRATIGQ